MSSPWADRDAAARASPSQPASTGDRRAEWRQPADADLRAALLELPVPLEVIARDLLGCGARISYVVRDHEGRVGLVQPAARGDDLQAWADLVAQLEWVAPRLADWQQLAPERHLDPGLPPRALLVANGFEERTRLAACGGPARVELWRLVASPAGLWLAEEPGPLPGPGPARAPEATPREPPLRPSGFRSRLRDEDL